MSVPAVQVTELRRSFRHVKTTLMSILTAQGFASSGSVRVFGDAPDENERVLRRICFIR